MEAVQSIPFAGVYATFSRRKLLLLSMAAALSPRLPLAAETPAPALLSEHDVQVQPVGQGFSVDFSIHTPVSQALAWAVLTDFEHMGQFLPGLTSSQVAERSETMVKVSQAGVVRYGLFSSAFESIREITITPRSQIRSHSIGGTVQSDSLMQLQPEGEGTHLTYHADVVPGRWFPPLVGPAVARRETSEQFSAMLREMLRRAAPSRP